VDGRLGVDTDPDARYTPCIDALNGRSKTRGGNGREEARMSAAYQEWRRVQAEWWAGRVEWAAVQAAWAAVEAAR
jgi:hypothetical protein